MPPDPTSQPPPLPPTYRPPAGFFGTLKKIFGPLLLIVVFGFKWLAKLKFIILPVLKLLPVLLKSGGSMFFTVWIYSMAWGWWFALGFVLLIFVHECGHLIAARRLGLNVGAPVFIPFMGAFIALKEAPKNAWIEAQVGIGGPVLGTIGAALCELVHQATGIEMFRALAYTGFLLNLFNLLPVGFLDGGRIVTALSPWLWLAGFAGLLALIVFHFNFILLIVLIVSLPRLFMLFRAKTDEERRFFEVTRAQRVQMTAMYFGLIAFLVLGMKVTLVTLQ